MHLRFWPDMTPSFSARLVGRRCPITFQLWGLRLAICQGFDQYVCLRPVTLLPGITSPLVNGTAESIDFVVVRENSEGEYAGVGGRTGAGRGTEIATQTAIFTEVGCERIIRYAFDLARTRPKRKVTSVTKSNAQQYGMTLWDDVFNRVRTEYPDIATEQWLVDAMAARFVLRPETLDVVVASNLFGDILSDLGSAIGGSLGIAASANIDPERRKPSMFEPVHGSAPDIAGQGIANPIGGHLERGVDAGAPGFTRSGSQHDDCDPIGNGRQAGHAGSGRITWHRCRRRRHSRRPQIAEPNGNKEKPYCRRVDLMAIRNSCIATNTIL